ncbi:hypothetical protein NLI96_g5517 [Meripilus lineatus]|uniref:HTH CENPB-type domain-containing protein n=1 Tax=Meripilus lineatus TaxID=2056292 RepID=A0AAD5YDU2_9APHY|nr:hypothetical protein NLI96_g5517 [Physisporinus lineatus]
MSDSPTPNPLSQEGRILLAIEDILSSGTRPNGKYVLSIRQAAALRQVPRTTLQDRFNGRDTRRESHTKEQKVSPAQEDVLVVWLKIMGRRGIPLTRTTLQEYASEISQVHIGDSWVTRFLRRHPDITVRWTTSLEACRANSLNRTLVREYFDILNELITTYHIPPENIYNMDEKGLLLGIGKRVAAIVDRDQKTVYSVEDGNRELVTVIETTCADGTALRPSFIFKGVRHDLEWGKKNPCNASILTSPKGWTDQELGSLWLEKDFEPATAARNKTDGYRLLILDGHNSHTTYRFCNFASNHRILIICLPSHTTHVLQPNDVGVFGPLGTSWKTIITETNRKGIIIRKQNVIYYYSLARDRVFTSTTISSAFFKTGIWPFNPAIIPDSAYDPSLNTTSQSAQPIPASLPAILTPIPTQSSSSTSLDPIPSSSVLPLPDSTSFSSAHPSSSIGSSSSQSMSSTTPTIASTSQLPNVDQQFQITGLPPRLLPTASRRDLRTENAQLRELLSKAGIELEKNYAQMRLMDMENGNLRQQLYNKPKKPSKKTSSHSRHLTNEENLQLLAKEEAMQLWKDVFKEAAPQFRAQKDKIKQFYQDEAAEQKRAVAAAKAVEREQEKLAKEAERVAKAEARERHRVAVHERKEAERAQRVADRVAEKERKEAERARKVAERIAEKERKAAEKAASEQNIIHRGRREAATPEPPSEPVPEVVSPRVTRRAKVRKVTQTRAVPTQEEYEGSPVRRRSSRRA